MLRSNAARYAPDRMAVTIVNFAPGEVSPEWWQEHGADYVSFPERPPTPASARRLYRFLCERKPDVVDVYGLRVNMVARPVARAAGVPVVISNVRGLDGWRKWYHVWGDRVTSRWVDMYVANSEAASLVCRDREHIRDAKRCVIRTGIDLGATGSDESREQVRGSFGVDDASVVVFLTAASFRPEKAHHVLIEAIRRRDDELGRCKFLLAGDGPLRPQIEALVDTSDLSDRVKFLGLRADVPRLLHGADVFVLPSAFESLPRSIIEAMAVGKAVIGTHVGGIPELIDEGKTGLLVPSGDARRLGDAIVRLATDAELSARMGAAGRRRAEACFDIRRAVDEIEALFRRLLERKG